jgi:hypothetical protein
MDKIKTLGLLLAVMIGLVLTAPAQVVPLFQKTFTNDTSGTITPSVLTITNRAMAEMYRIPVPPGYDVLALQGICQAGGAAGIVSNVTVYLTGSLDGYRFPTNHIGKAYTIALRGSNEVSSVDTVLTNAYYDAVMVSMIHSTMTNKVTIKEIYYKWFKSK